MFAYCFKILMFQKPVEAMSVYIITLFASVDSTLQQRKGFAYRLSKTSNTKSPVENKDLSFIPFIPKAMQQGTSLHNLSLLKFPFQCTNPSDLLLNTLLLPYNNLSTSSKMNRLCVAPSFPMLCREVAKGNGSSQLSSHSSS